jgi:hypothetical protein
MILAELEEMLVESDLDHMLSSLCKILIDFHSLLVVVFSDPLIMNTTHVNPCQK